MHAYQGKLSRRIISALIKLEPDGARVARRSQSASAALAAIGRVSCPMAVDQPDEQLYHVARAQFAYFDASARASCFHGERWRESMPEHRDRRHCGLHADEVGALASVRGLILSHGTRTYPDQPKVLQSLPPIAAVGDDSRTQRSRCKTPVCLEPTCAQSLWKLSLCAEVPTQH